MVPGVKELVLIKQRGHGGNVRREVVYVGSNTMYSYIDTNSELSKFNPGGYTWQVPNLDTFCTTTRHN